MFFHTFMKCTQLHEPRQEPPAIGKVLLIENFTGK
jgi:hypothetical protein